MTKDELIALAEKVEAHTKADEECDALIYLALNQPNWREGEPWKKTNGWFKPGCATDAMAYFFHDGMGRSHKTAPRYTASLDAALTLVPEGWAWSATGTGYAEVRHPRFRANDAEGRAKTPALAMVSAALRAHATTLGD